MIRLGTRGMSVWTVLVACAVAGPLVTTSPRAAQAQAQAQTAKTAKDLYLEGRTHYDLGRFEEAIKSFQKAYELKPDPAFLFNIAQAYRQLGNARQALFFYKRYLALSPDAPNRKEVSRLVEELEKEIAQGKTTAPPAVAPAPAPAPVTTPTPAPKPESPPQTAPSAPTPDSAPSARDATSATPKPTDGTSDDTDVAKRAPIGKLPRIRVGVDLGPAIVDLGEYPNEVPAQATVQLAGSYTFWFGVWGVDVGALVGFTSLPYVVAGTTSEESSTQLSTLLQVGARRPMGAFTPRVELGVGRLGWSGLGQGNPFTEQFPANDGEGRLGGMAEGSVSATQVRFAIAVDWALTRSIALGLTPFAFSTAQGGSRLVDSIDAVTRVDFLVGVSWTR